MWKEEESACGCVGGVQAAPEVWVSKSTPAWTEGEWTEACFICMRLRSIPLQTWVWAAPHPNPTGAPSGSSDTPLPGAPEDPPGSSRLNASPSVSLLCVLLEIFSVRITSFSLLLVGHLKMLISQNFLLLIYFRVGWVGLGGGGEIPQHLFCSCCKKWNKSEIDYNLCSGDRL